MMPEKKTKPKREIPLRDAGAPVATQTNRPSLLLFDEVKRLETLDVQKNSLLDVQLIAEPDVQEILPQAPNNKTLGRPITTPQDVQDVKSKTSKTLISGRPTVISSDAKTSKTVSRTSGDELEPDVKTPTVENLDVQGESEKEKRKTWENNRSTARLTLRPNSEILRKFKIFCIEKDLGITEFFEIAGLKFIELDVQVRTDSDVLTPLDDRRLKIMFKTKPFIINLYLRYNSVFNELAARDGKKWTARWSPRDDEAAVRYNDAPASIIELGILQTQLQKGFGSSRIQTFKYYTDEIEKILLSGVSDEMLNTILKYHRQMWASQTGREVDLEFLEGKN